MPVKNVVVAEVMSIKVLVPISLPVPILKLSSVSSSPRYQSVPLPSRRSERSSACPIPSTRSLAVLSDEAIESCPPESTESSVQFERSYERRSEFEVPKMSN